MKFNVQSENKAKPGPAKLGLGLSLAIIKSCNSKCLSFRTFWAQNLSWFGLVMQLFSSCVYIHILPLWRKFESNPLQNGQEIYFPGMN